MALSVSTSETMPSVIDQIRSFVAASGEDQEAKLGLIPVASLAVIPISDRAMNAAKAFNRLPNAKSHISCMKIAKLAVEATDPDSDDAFQLTVMTSFDGNTSNKQSNMNVASWFISKAGKPEDENDVLCGDVIRLDDPNLDTPEGAVRVNSLEQMVNTIGMRAAN